MTIPEAKLVGLVRVHLVAGGGSGIDDPTTIKYGVEPDGLLQLLPFVKLH